MDRADRIIIACGICLVFIWAAIGYNLNRERIRVLQIRVNALEAEDK